MTPEAEEVVDSTSSNMRPSGFSSVSVSVLVVDCAVTSDAADRQDEVENFDNDLCRRSQPLGEERATAGATGVDVDAATVVVVVVIGCTTKD